MQRLLLGLLLVLAWHQGTSLSLPPALAAGAFWKQSPESPTSTNAPALTAERGPWMVMAASFSGPAGETEARQLVGELREQFGLPAYYYGMTFQLGDGNPGRGIDQYGGRIKRRYQRGNEVLQHAVLVGDFPSLSNPAAQKMLQQIKHLRPAALTDNDGQPTSQSLAAVRKFHNLIHQKLGKPQAKGPLGHAFLTKNPLLPKEYFVPPGVDPKVAKWNQDLEFSLLTCPGNFSMRVATFKGRRSFQGANQPVAEETPKKTSDALVKAAENAHLLTAALREKGWEAYEFHDRHESYVAVGSFQDATVQPNGTILLTHPDAKTIIETFGARSPHNIFNRPAQQDLLLEQRQKAKFQQLLGDNKAHLGQGFHPKRFVGLPFDIDPQPVRVPRQSVSSAYARN